jgi:hypothetical protein
MCQVASKVDRKKNKNNKPQALGQVVNRYASIEFQIQTVHPEFKYLNSRCLAVKHEQTDQISRKPLGDLRNGTPIFVVFADNEYPKMYCPGAGVATGRNGCRSTAIS